MAYPSQYSITPPFLFQSQNDKPLLGSERQQRQARMKARQHASHSNLKGYFKSVQKKLNLFSTFYLGFLLLLPFLFGLTRSYSKFAIFAFAQVGLVLAASSFVSYQNPHYIAPIASLIFLLCVKGLRDISNAPTRFPGLVRAVLLSTILSHTIQPAVAASRLLIRKGIDFSQSRQVHLEDLQTLSGDHVVIVRYSQHYYLPTEWVYNGADIDNAKVIWAHDLRRKRNRELLNYYRKRTIWLVDPSIDPEKRTLYLNETGASRAD